MDFYTKSEVAEKIRRSTIHVMRLVKAGVLPRPVKLGTPGGQCLFPKSEVDQAIAKLIAARPEVA